MILELLGPANITRLEAIILEIKKKIVEGKSFYAFLLSQIDTIFDVEGDNVNFERLYSELGQFFDKEIDLLILIDV